MHPLFALLLLSGLVVVTLLAGLLWRRRQGAAHAVAFTDAVDLALLAAPGSLPRLGTRGTLVQFSTAFCSGCPATRRVLHELAARGDGIAYLDVDVTERADLVRRFAILQTPTTLILDRHGVVRTRIGGSVRRSVVEERLEALV
ncbi:thioredoxin family protein [Herbiconiux sp. VKM Ac-2851]|uniref:TlpA family protein disulfide reductase n=1 Tax=Herbiconiux sp. VKM Ac-2851 TaxID=2739025 RepID=UPI0015676369|nr:thioredoxin family protein [Herbiconiux sp. VKM Ac-2851]NQX33908.1 thioredoxin family protein [Herbiconiux sp. VKM Ac-2851]